MHGSNRVVFNNFSVDDDFELSVCEVLRVNVLVIYPLSERATFTVLLITFCCFAEKNRFTTVFAKGICNFAFLWNERCCAQS